MQTEIITAVNTSGFFSDGNAAMQSFYDALQSLDSNQYTKFTSELLNEKNSGILTNETATWDQSSTTLVFVREFSEPWLDIKNRWIGAGVNIETINTAWINAGFEISVTHLPMIP